MIVFDGVIGAMDVIPGVKKIAVLRAVALGDYIVALPALEALRTTYPQANIALLARPWNKTFVDSRKSPVDRVIVIPPSRGVRVEPDMQEDAAELERFFMQLRDEKFDLAIQLHGGGTNSNPFV